MKPAHDFQFDIDAIAAISAVPSILDVICRTTGMGWATVARVTDERWVMCSVQDNLSFGLEPGAELPINQTFCKKVREDRHGVLIDHVAEDEIYKTHPVPAQYGFQSYISIPIILSDGRFFGTLCALDPKPNSVKSPEVVGMFNLFAQLIASQLESGERLLHSQGRLEEQLRIAEVREQFIAVLGHDLRNPLGAISSAATVLERLPQTEKGLTLIGMMRKSALRMGELIDNVMDLARSRLGSGLSVARSHSNIEPIVMQVVSEARAKWPDRTIIVDMQHTGDVYCDPFRMAQLLSNLLANALTYGAADKPVAVRASAPTEGFELSVANAGTPIPAEKLGRLFEPFSRGDTPSDNQGLGLGLYISTEIAKAHGGQLVATSTVDETRFTLRL